MIRKEIKVILLAISCLLIGCKSEIDKCVDLEMKVWDINQLKVQKDWQTWQAKVENIRKSGNKEIIIEYGIVEPDQRSRLEVESVERKRCMSIAAGKG